MNLFSKRTEIIFLSCTAVLLISGTLLVAFSNEFIPYLYDFISQKVFHREFKIEKWLPTLQSFFMIPVFLTICVNAVVFHKHSDKLKITYLSVLIACIAFFVVYTVYKAMPNFIDADLSSETLLARECVREKSLVPLGWGYSTEIRLLNTQLISAPLFLFIKSWDWVRSLTSLFSCAVLFASCWFLLSRLGIKKNWLKMLGSSLLACPWSELHFYVIGWGNYYIPHIVLGFLTLAVFIPILNGTAKNKKRSVAVFYVLAFVSGLSTIRYILIYQFPLFLAVTILCSKKEKLSQIHSFLDAKNFFLKNNSLLISFVALLLSGIGYVFNNAVLHSLYHFSQWNDVTFNFFGDVPLQKLLVTIIRAFGYQQNIAVFTPGGVINICVYCALALFVVNLVANFKGDISVEKRLLLIFTLCTIGFNSFLYYHTEFIGRFYITILAYMIPCIIVFLENEQTSVLKRYGLGVFFAVCIFSSSYSSVQAYLTRDANKNIKPVMAFLSEKCENDSDYSFGYSTFDFANLVTYFSKEKIEVATLKKVRRDGHDALPDTFKESTWLTPLRLQKKVHDGKTFLLVSEEIFSASSAFIFEKALLVYQDSNFRVYEYSSQEDFVKSFRN